MRTPDTWLEHDRDGLRYPSDLTGEEWQILAPLFPPPARTGRRRSWQMREVINAIFFVLRGGIPWRMLPGHFPPHQTAYRRFMATIGRNSAVVAIGKLRLRSFVGWIFWSLVYILFLIGFRNRVIVGFNWARSWITQKRGVRLIAESAPVGDRDR